MTEATTTGNEDFAGDRNVAGEEEMKQEPTSSNANTNFLLGGGEMGARIRAKDWSKTPLGAPEKWSQSLKTAVRIMLTCRQPMFVWWGEELINLYNDAYKPVVGGKHPEALGQPATVVWREIWDQVGPRAESAMLKNEGTFDESLLLIMERNGYPEETYYTFSYSPIPNDDGSTGGIICANTDETQRVISKRQLVLLQELAAKTADARTFDAACTLSVSCLETNPYDLPFAAIYLVDSEQRLVLAGTSRIERGHPAAPEIVALDGDTVLPFAQVLKTQQTLLISDLESHFDNLPMGTWQRSPHQAVAVPIAPSGQTGKAGILVVGLNPFRLFDDSYKGFIDLVAAQIAGSIANAQAYEEERKRAEALAEIDRAKTVFFSNVSHEFRTPLTLMLGPLEETLTNSSSQLAPEDREQLEMVQRNGFRLLKLVNTLLDFSRIEAGRVQAVYEPIDLASFTAELASVFRSAIERAGMQLIVNCPPLPAPVYVDREMWEKIVLNLLSNAFKFTFTGKITVSLQCAGNWVELAIADTGIGIPAIEMPHLFERFHRVKGAQGRTFEGSGIGLSLVRELVQMHGGTVRATSVLGAGSCFTVSIPTGTAHLPPDRIGAARTATSTALGATPYLQEALRWLPEEERGVRSEERGKVTSEFQIANCELRITNSSDTACILLVEDNADMRDYVKRLLDGQYKVVAVSDGLAALAAVRQTIPDLVLTDVMMPGLDGFGLLRSLRADPLTREVPIILLSARAGEEARVEGLEAGADNYLIKPFSARELLARVEATLKLSQLRQEATRREQGLRAEAEAAKIRLESVLEGIEDQFNVLDREWRYIFINDRVTKVTGKRQEELLGKRIWDVFPDLIGSSFESQLQSAVAEQTVARVEFFYPPLQRWFEIRIYPFTEGVTLFATDVTDRKATEAERDRLLQLEQAARAEAERANRVKDEFLAVLSHELRSPLNPILGWVKLLRTRKFDAQATDRALETIERNAKLQTQLIEDLLDVSRILRGKMALNISSVNLATTIEAALETVQLAAEAKSIQIQTVIAPAVGLVSGDANRLQQIVWNLLSNAIKFTPSGGRVEIWLEQVEQSAGELRELRELRGRREQLPTTNYQSPTPDSRFPIPDSPKYAQIQVRDTGKGINPEFLPYVFEYFRQEDGKTTRKFGGLGLGLAIVRHITELHGGTVTTESLGEGHGATFTVKLPLLKDTSKVVETDPVVPLSCFSPNPLQGIRVLLVDDEADMLELAQVILKQYGAEVSVAVSATEALSNFDCFEPNLLISDIGMPNIDGYMLMQQIRQRSPQAGGQIPAIALTAYAAEFDRQLALRSGFQLHLPKPVEPEKLVHAVCTLIEIRV